MRKPRPLATPLRKRADKHTRRRIAIKRAPKHPAGPEQQIRLATLKLFDRYHGELVDKIKPIALRYRARRRGLRRDSTTASDASPATGTRDPMLASVFASVHQYALQLLHESPYKRILREAAQHTAKSAKDQTAKALGLGRDYAPDLSEHSDQLASDVFDGAAELVPDSLERAEDVLDEWSDLGDASPRDGDVAALGGMLEDGLAGITGKALNLASLTFGYAFGQLIQAAQKAGGAGHYAWMAQHDSVVRPEHLALDNGDVYAWDDPPLEADDSSSGEECHPGEDYNCRCVASPVMPEEVPEEES